MVATTTVTIEQVAGLVSSLRDEVAVLADRLERGWQLIDERSEAGMNTDQLHAHFASLLEEYQTACDRLRALGF